MKKATALCIIFPLILIPFISCSKNEKLQKKTINFGIYLKNTLNAAVYYQNGYRRAYNNEGRDSDYLSKKILIAPGQIVKYNRLPSIEEKFPSTTIPRTSVAPPPDVLYLYFNAMIKKDYECSFYKDAAGQQNCRKDAANFFQYPQGAKWQSITHNNGDSISSVYHIDSADVRKALF